MSLATPSLTAKLAELDEGLAGREMTLAEASQLLAGLRHEFPEFDAFLSRRFARLPAAHQHLLLRLLHAAQAREFASALHEWSRSPALSLSVRARALTILDHFGGVVDRPYSDALLHTQQTLEQLRRDAPAPLAESGELPATLQHAVLNLPFALALDLVHELAPDQPHTALAVVRGLRPIADAKESLALAECLANIPLTESIATLQEMLTGTPDKTLQKAVKKALHRLKTRGVSADTEAQQPHTVVVGAVTHRLEKCLASHIDGTGDRAIWMIRTKAFGGYNVAYLILNYGTGIQMAMGLQASKRELPELLAKAQERVRLIDLEPAYCQYQVALAHQMNLDTHTPVPEEFFALRDIIGEAETTFEKALIYTVLSEADLQEAQAYADHAQELLELPEFAGWTLPSTILQKYADQLLEIEESQIVVSSALKQERINEVYARATEEALGERSRRLMRLRLEEMAYYLLQTGRRREALWTVAAARSLEETDPARLRHNPFAGALLERSLESAKTRPSSRIIQPFSRPPPPSSEGRGLII